MDVAVGDNLLKLVYRHSIRTCVPGLIACIFIGFFISEYTSNNAWAYWLMFAISIQVLRPLVLKWTISSKSLDMQSRLILAGFNSVILGTSLGSCVVFFPELDYAQRFILSMVLVGAGGVAGTLNNGYPPFYLCFVIPTLVPINLYWLTDPYDQISLTTSLVLIGMAFMQILIVTFMGRHNFNTFSDLIKLSHKQQLMSDKLSDALERAELEQEHAVASSRSKTRFLAAASHDLRQPVHILSLYSSSLENMVEKESAKEVVADMNQTVRSLSRQLNELLDIAKLDSDSLKPSLSQLEIYSVVSLIAGEFQNEAKINGVDLINRVDRAVYVYSDNTMLSQILRNIIGNAVKFTREGSVILSNQVNNYSVSLSIRDTGIGMTEDEQHYIFEEFYQVDNPERSKEKGTGLGLSIVKRLANKLSHDVSVTSKANEGTCVSLTLALCKNNQINVQQPKLAALIETETVNFAIWVHIVDDEPSVRKSMGMLLKELGCKVTSSTSTSETKEFMELNKPDVFLVDYRLQGNDTGIHTINAIKSTYADSRCVMITGDKYFDFDKKGLMTSVEVLHKPVSESQIIELLKALPVAPAVEAAF